MTNEGTLVSQFTEAELNMYAPQLRKFNGVTGFKICTVKSDNIDLKYKEKRNMNNISSLTTNIPVRKYFVESFMVIAIKLDKLANGTPVVIFNENPDLTFPLSADACSALLHVTKKDVNDAIREFEDSKGEKVKFFTDIKLCVQVVNELNKLSKDALETLAETLMNQSCSLQTIIDAQTDDLDKYLKTIEE